MPQFIHLTDERLLKRLEKSGIRMTKWGKKIRCVYATPVLKDFQVSHQWLRELKNKGIWFGNGRPNPALRRLAGSFGELHEVCVYAGQRSWHDTIRGGGTTPSEL